MSYEFKAVRRVEFNETDMAGLVHYSNFFRYMETAESGFFRSLGHSIVTDRTDPPVGWPRVHAQCDYAEPLFFEDEVEIHLLVAEKKARALTYVFKFRKLNANPPIEIARSRLTVVCVTRDATGRMRAAKIPTELADQISVAPPELLA